MLAIGFDNLDGPFIGSFTATPDGEIIHKPQRIHYLREPSDTSQLNVRQMSNPEKGMLMRPYVLKFEKEAEYADQEFGDMAYAPTLDAVVNNLREMILHDTSQRGTSKNVDIVIAGPTSRWLPRNIVQFSHYSELPDMWIQEEEQTGYPENQGEPVPQAKFFERFKNDVKIRNNPKANFMYRLLLSGMQEVKEEFTKYQVGAAFYYAKGWENDPIKTEIHHVHGYAPRELLSKRKLKKRLNWAQTVFDEYMGIFQSSRNLK